MKRFRASGKRIKELRRARERRPTQKEFCHEVRVSEQRLRAIKNGNDEVTTDELNRIAKALGVKPETIIFSIDQPHLATGGGKIASAPGVTAAPKPVVVPRFDTDQATVTTDEATLFKDATENQVLVSHVLTKLTDETGAYMEEIVSLLSSVSGCNCTEPRMPIDGAIQLPIRRRLKALIVILRGNDVWVYTTTHWKHLPESHVVLEKCRENLESQLIITFGPPAEHGESAIEVPIDHGQPWVYRRNACSHRCGVGLYG